MKANISIIHVAFKLSLCLIAVLLGFGIVAQDFKSLDELDEGQTEIGITSEKFQHHHMALSFGFESSESFATTKNNNRNIPVIGLNYNYWLDEGLGFGVRSAFSLAEYEIINGDTSSIQRKYPVSLSPQMLLNPVSGLHFSIGPGIEIDKEKNLFVFHMGLGYSMKLLKHFDIGPELYYCFKQSAMGSYGLNLNLGWRFGE